MKTSNLTNTPSSERPLHKRITLQGLTLAASSYSAQLGEVFEYNGTAELSLPYLIVIGICWAIFGGYRHIPTT